MQEELQALIRLINTWEEENIELAFQIIKGNRALRKAAAAHYEPIMEIVGKKFSKINVKNLPVELGHAKNCQLPIPYSEALAKTLQSIHIRYIDYGHRELTEFPWWVCEFAGLKQLNLPNNRISEIPETISNLKALEVLNMNHNELTALPAAIGELKAIQKLQFDFNEIEEIPASIGNLMSLDWLCLEANNIKSLPKSLGDVKKLSWLSIEKTPLGEKHKITYGMFIDVNSQDFKKLLD